MIKPVLITNKVNYHNTWRLLTNMLWLLLELYSKQTIDIIMHFDSDLEYRKCIYFSTIP